MPYGVGVAFGARDTGLDAMNKKIAASAGKITEEYKRGARELKAAEKAGVRSFSMVETAAEKYKRELKNINAALRANLITQRQANRAITGAQQRMRGQSAIMASIASSARGYLATWLSIQAATSFITREMQLQLAIFDKTATDVDQMADAQRRLITNLGPNTTSAQKRQFINELSALAQEPGVAFSPTILTAQASRMVSATNLPFDERKALVLDTIRQAAPLFISRPEEFGSFGGALQAFVTTMKREGVGLNSKEAFGLFVTGQSRFRTEQVTKLKNLVPVLRQAEQSELLGDRKPGRPLSLETAKAVMAAFAVIGSEAEDPDSEKTRTAMNKMIKTLENKFPDLTFTEQVKAAGQLSPGAMKEFLKPLNALRGIGSTVEGFLRGQERLEGSFKETMKALVVSEEDTDRLTKDLLGLTEVLRQSTGTKQAAAISEATRLEKLAAPASARARIIELTESEGTFGRSLIRLAADISLIMGTDPKQVEIEAIRRMFSPSREPEISAAIGINSERLEKMTEALGRLDRIYGISPETKGE